MSRVLYGFDPKNKQKPFVMIYQRHRDVSDPIRMRRYRVIDERATTVREETDVIPNIRRDNRVYNYPTVDDLVDDELRFLAFTPYITEQNLRVYEASCKQKAKA